MPASKLDLYFSSLRPSKKEMQASEVSYPAPSILIVKKSAHRKKVGGRS